MDKVIECFADKLVSYFGIHGYIDKTKESVYKYGTIVAIQSAINVVSTLILGVVFGLFFENLCFLIVFKITRKFSGGFHFKKFIVCFSSSIILDIFFLLNFQLLLVYPIFHLVFYIELVSCIVIVVLSPVVNKNKFIKNKEYVVYKLITVIICIVLLCISLFLVSKKSAFVYSVCMAIVFDAVSIILSSITRTKQTRF